MTGVFIWMGKKKQIYTSNQNVDFMYILNLNLSLSVWKG